MLTFNKQCLYACGSGTIIHCWVRITAHFSHLFASPEVYKFILCSILYYQYFHPTPPPTGSIISPIKPPFSPGTSFTEKSVQPPPGFFFTAFLGQFPVSWTPDFCFLWFTPHSQIASPPKKVVEKVTVQGSWLSENILILYSNFSLAGYTILG